MSNGLFAILVTLGSTGAAVLITLGIIWLEDRLDP